MKHVIISLVFILLILGLTAYILQTVSKDKYTWTYAEDCINNGYDENPIKCSHCISNFCKQFQEDEEVFVECLDNCVDCYSKCGPGEKNCRFLCKRMMKNEINKYKGVNPHFFDTI